MPSIDEHLHFDAEFVILYFAEGLGVVLRFPEGEDDKICTKLVGSLILNCLCIMTISALVYIWVHSCIYVECKTKINV